MRTPFWILMGLAACTAQAGAPAAKPASLPASAPSSGSAPKAGALAPEPEPGLEVATFAGGCFWCMEPPFEKLSGVKAVVSGYTGGKEPAPTYKQVGYGRTGHAEAVRVYFDPDFVTYEELLDTFWRSIDPTDAGGQFADRGAHYRTAIFVHDEMQKAAADASKSKLSASKKFEAAIVTPVESVGPFWVAEEYHQDYYKKNPGHYQRYRRGSGRAGFLEKHWGKKSS